MFYVLFFSLEYQEFTWYILLQGRISVSCWVVDLHLVISTDPYA